MLRKLSYAAAVLILGGCVSQEPESALFHPTITDLTLPDRDGAGCQVSARVHVQPTPAIPYQLNPVSGGGFFGGLSQGLNSRGVGGTGPYSYTDTGTYIACMQSKGYLYVLASDVPELRRRKKVCQESNNYQPDQVRQCFYKAAGLSNR